MNRASRSQCLEGVLMFATVLLALPQFAAAATGADTQTMCKRFPASEATKIIGSPVEAPSGKPIDTWCAWNNPKSGLSVTAAAPGTGLDPEQFKSMMREQGRGKERDESAAVGVPAYSVSDAAIGQATIWMLVGQQLYLLQLQGAGATNPAALAKLRPAARRLAGAPPR